MLRAKRIQEMMVWWNSPDPTAWINLNHALDAVFLPKLLWVSAGQTTPQSGMERERLWYTLREDDQGGIDETMDFKSVAVGASDVVEIYLSFIDTAQAGPLRLNLECAVSDPAVRGRVYVLQPGTMAWMAVPIDDFAQAPGQFGFFAPLDPGGVWYRTRRTFPGVPSFQAFPSQLILKIVLQRPIVEQASFSASFDLVQIVGEGTTEPSVDSDEAQGADFDYSGAVEPIDLNAFYAAWLDQSPAADFNMDGVVDTADLVAFLQAYAQ